MIVLLLLCSLGLYAQTDSQRKYEILFHEAMLQRQKGHHDATFDLLSRCLELKPDASESYFFLAQYYSEIKNADKALVYFKKAADLCPGDMIYLETLAQSYISKEQYTDAITVVEKMYEHDKSRQELLEMLYRMSRPVASMASRISLIHHSSLGFQSYYR